MAVRQTWAEDQVFFLQPQMQPLQPRQPGRHRPSVRRPHSGDIELWRTLGVIQGVLGVSARAVASTEVRVTVRDLVQWKLLVMK